MKTNFPKISLILPLYLAILSTIPCARAETPQICERDISASSEFALSDDKIQSDRCGLNRSEAADQILVDKKKVSACVHCYQKSRTLWQDYEARSRKHCESHKTAPSVAGQNESHAKVSELLTEAQQEKESLLRVLAEIEENAVVCQRISADAMRTYEEEKRRLEATLRK